MPSLYDAIVIGAGHFGLGVSYYLKKANVSHTVLERGQIGESWRSQRWDSFMMNTPNRVTNMPDTPYEGPEPEGFRSLSEFLGHLQRFAEGNQLPVQTDTQVAALRASATAGLYEAETSQGTIAARNVVIATGCQNRPLIPLLARDMPGDLVQMHAATYRNPRSLPDGAVLVVGCGSSGCQITEDLLEAGRTVYLATGKMTRAPRRYRGRDIGIWNYLSGSNRQRVEEFEDQSIRLHPPRMNLLSGTRGGHTISLQSLSTEGAILLGRLKGCEAGQLLFEADVQANIRFADDTAAAVKQRIDAYIARSGIAAPPPTPDPAETCIPVLPDPPILSLDPREAGISTLLWCTGFDGDFSWIHLPVFTASGWPDHVRGVTAAPGITFIGLHWLIRRASNTALFIDLDAQEIAGQVIDRVNAGG